MRRLIRAEEDGARPHAIAAINANLDADEGISAIDELRAPLATVLPFARRVKP